MVYDIFGGTGINIEIPREVFPTQEELDSMEEQLSGGKHGWFESSFEKKRLHYHYFLPKDGKIKGILVYCHGVQTNCMHGTTVDGQKLSGALMVDSFLAKGIVVYSFDYLGHGFSEGTRFWIPDWKNNMMDIVAFCKLVTSQRHPSDDVPLFVSGESYGGCLSIHVARYFQDHPDDAPANFDSILLTAPAIIGDLPPFPVYQILRYGLAPFFPRWKPFFMPNPISPDRIWRNPKVLEELTTPRYHEMGIDGGGLPFRLGTALNLVVALEEVRNKAIPGLKVPFCTIHGTADYGVPIEGSEYLMEHCVTPQSEREFHRIDGGYHDLFCDPLAEEAMGHWISFVDKRLKSRG